jgi:alkylation response protein AidB-like acyl-CoA dehydrogenase
MANVIGGARGGEWLLERTPGTFTPEDITDEHRLIGETAAAFVRDEVVPALDDLEAKRWTRARDLLRRCGELGLLGVSVPEAFGGVDLDKVSALLVSEGIAPVASFAATYGAQANLCILPLVLFGTPDQQQRYLPKLVSGELTGAYALSESGSGSDALAARARAVRRDDGSYVLSGEKMWITNGGFADVIIVFAKVDGEQFTAFVVERAFGGVTSGPEEHKMGLHGSSTTAVLLQDVVVPAANVLGEIGRGHKVAFNVLNFGRFKLGAMCLGGAKAALADAARYAVERRQFGQPIAAFGAIRHKLGEMTARTYALESLMYRTAALLDARIAAAPGAHASATLAALEEFAIEASIAKVAGSETLEFVLDEDVQIHGGNGYVRDYPAERNYRDSRVNRIFEGTNEINRLLIPGMLLKRAARGDLPVVAAGRRLRDELMTPSVPALDTSPAPLDAASRDVDALRKVVLLVAGAAYEQFGDRLEHEQEVLLWLADLAIETYAADSAVLRAQSAAANARPDAALHEDAAVVTTQRAARRVDAAAREALAATLTGDALRLQLAALRRLLKIAPVNTVERRRRMADRVAAGGGYPFR